MNKLHDWLIAATTIARISEGARALGEEITWLRREAHVRGECLEVAIGALSTINARRPDIFNVQGVMAEIEQRLAQLEPEEKTG